LSRWLRYWPVGQEEVQVDPVNASPAKQEVQVEAAPEHVLHSIEHLRQNTPEANIP
jgi:hypothetical protein